MSRPTPSIPPHEFAEAEEPSTIARLATRFAALSDDLPFVPLRPYEPRRLQIGWRAAVLLLLCVGVYVPGLGGGWLWQDEPLIANDLAHRSVKGLASIWTRPFAADLSPAARTLAWLEFHVFGASPTGFRLASLGLHAWAVVFAWLAMRRLSVPGAWLAAAAVAVHPAAMPTLAWASRQGDAIAAAAAATAVWAYFVARRVRPAVDDGAWTDPAFHDDEDHAPRWPWAVFGVAAAVSLACGSVTPVLVAIALLAIEWRRGTASRAGRIALVAFVVLAVAARIGLPHGRLPATADTPGPIRSAVVEAVGAWPWTTLHAIVPVEPAFVYDRFAWSGWLTLAVMTSITLAAVTAAVVRPRGRTVALAAAAVVAVLHGATAGRAASPAVLAADLLPPAVLGVVVAAAAATIVAALHRYASRPVEHAGRWGVGVAIVLGLGALTAVRGLSYESAETLWQRVLAMNPDSVVARQELAGIFLAEHFNDEAGIQLDRVAEPRRGVTWRLARGRAFEAQRDYAAAAECYESAHRDRPDDVATTIALAETHNNGGRPERAADVYAELLARTRTDASLFTNAGLTQMRLGHANDAIELYENALRVDPNYIPAHVNIANALFESSRLPEAAEHLQRVIAIDPRNFVAFMNAGAMIFRLGDPAKAERMFRAAVHLNPRSADAYRKLGTALAAQKKTAEATWSFGQAARVEHEPTP